MIIEKTNNNIHVPFFITYMHVFRKYMNFPEWNTYFYRISYSLP